VGVAGCTGKTVGVSVGGNQTTVAVGVALGAAVGVTVAGCTALAQPVNIHPHAARRIIKVNFLCAILVSFIVIRPEVFLSRLLYNK
jgi:predicted small secreted protein